MTIIRAIDKGHLIGYRLPVSGHRRVLISEVEKWMDSTGIPKDLLHDEYGLGTSEQGEPVPICNKPDWCLVSKDGSTAICPRVERTSAQEMRAGFTSSILCFSQGLCPHQLRSLSRWTLTGNGASISVSQPWKATCMTISSRPLASASKGW